MSTNKDNKISEDIALLLGRIGLGGAMLIAHGWPKMSNYSVASEKFPALFGMTSATCLVIAIFAEFFCAILLILGLGTRFALSQLIATMAVGIYYHTSVLDQKLFDAPGKASGELALVYLLAYSVLIILGPGRLSIDKIIKNKRKK